MIEKPGLPLLTSLLDHLSRPRTATLHGGGVVLRPPRRRDHKAWAVLRARSRGFLQPYEPLWPEDDLHPAAWSRRLTRYRRDAALKLGHVWLIWQAQDRQEVLVGGVSLTGVRHGVMQAATLGYWVGAPFARQGLTSSAVDLVIRHANHDLGLGRIEAATLPDNEPSIRLLQKHGFEAEGQAKRYLRINGTWRDHILFSLTRRELTAQPARNAAPNAAQSSPSGAMQPVRPQ